MSNGNPTISAGQVPRQPTYWDDLTLVTKVLQLDGTYSPGVTALLYSANGMPWPGVTMRSEPFSLSATGTIVTNSIAQTVNVYAIKLICAGTAVVKWINHLSSDIEGAQTIVDGGGYIESVEPPAFLFKTESGSDLDLFVSGGGTAAGRISYWTEPATP